ncbi:phosphoadenosine phosphosulfate reductase family protein [Mycobacterium xenopi 3993]|nr:phosphoadenosine phosphosulfate reductase family protein [Mycobacterium xenopi 3993]
MSDSTTWTEARLRELAARGAAELDGASATELLQWTDETFGGVNGPRGWATCNYVVASNMQDAVLVDLAAKVRPGVPVLFLDTGYHFVETIGTRDAIEAVYDVHVLNITPEHTVAEQDRLLGKNLFARDPTSAVGCVRSPAGQGVARLRSVGDGAAPSRGADARQRPLISFDEQFKLVKVNPLAAWTDQDVADYIAEHDVLVNPLVYEGYPSIGCARARPSRSTAPTRAAGAGRGPARSNAGCTRRDHTRIDRTRQRGSSRGRQCPRCRAPVAAHPARSGRAGGVLRAHLAAPGRRADAGCRCQPAAVGRRLPRSRRHTTTNRRFCRCAPSRCPRPRRAPTSGAARKTQRRRGFPTGQRSRRSRGGYRLVVRRCERAHLVRGAEAGGGHLLGRCRDSVCHQAQIAGTRCRRVAAPRGASAGDRAVGAGAGRLVDRVREFAQDGGIPMAARLVPTGWSPRPCWIASTKR